MSNNSKKIAKAKRDKKEESVGDKEDDSADDKEDGSGKAQKRRPWQPQED